jgi:hypothetical protein
VSAASVEYQYSAARKGRQLPPLLDLGDKDRTKPGLKKFTVDKPICLMADMTISI